VYHDLDPESADRAYPEERTLAVDETDYFDSIRAHGRDSRRTGITEQSNSGERGCARLKRGARRVHMDERRRYGLARQFDSLRERQGRWRCGHGRAGESDDGAYRARVTGLLVGIWTGRGQLLLGGLYRRRGLRRNRMEVAERKRELDGDRKQRDPCAKSDVRPHPIHRDNAPRVEGRNTPLPPTLQHNIATAALICQPPTPGKNS
jgi:hypothetical protein